MSIIEAGAQTEPQANPKSELLPPMSNDLTFESSDLAWVESWTNLLDTKYTIPGTKIRFGADFLLGLIPGVGDVASLGLSGVLIATMAKHGASKLLVVRMMLNVFIDTLVGSVPVLGNVFDLFYKANYRNLKLMREYYHEGKHAGSVWPFATGVIAAIGTAIGISVWLIGAFIGWLWQLF